VAKSRCEKGKKPKKTKKPEYEGGKCGLESEKKKEVCKPKKRGKGKKK